MSSALAIAGVTAVLKDLLDSGLIDQAVADNMGRGISVSTRAPDLIELKADMPSQLNLFLYQVSPNAAWRNAGLPSRDAAGERLGNPPLALDLHYLLTAYAASDLDAQILLGYGMQLLHENPVLARGAIRKALNPPASPVDQDLPSQPAGLSAADLADQAELIKIVPEYLNGEETSRLWSALQSRYRPSVSYKASVVLIQAREPVRTPLPVLRRDIRVVPSAAPPYPALRRLNPAAPAAPVALGEALVLEGENLAGSNHRLRLAHAQLQTPFSFAPASVLGTRISAVLPDQPADIPAGHHVLSLSVDQPNAEGLPRTQVSNPLTLAVEPRITSPGPLSFGRVGGTATVTLNVAPQVRPGQQVSLIVGTREVPASAFAAATSTLSFAIAQAVPGIHRLRLRVDGVDSRLVNRSTTPPSFVPGQELEIT